MKRHKTASGSTKPKVASGGVRRRTQRNRHGSDTNELLRICLAKVCELQRDLEREEDYESDPQAAGYAACAMETLQFLRNEGLPNDHPMVKLLTERILNNQ